MMEMRRKGSRLGCAPGWASFARLGGVVVSSVLLVQGCADGESTADGAARPTTSQDPQREPESVPACGDGLVDVPEVCESRDPYCSADCMSLTGSCGDGILQANETCEGGGVCLVCQRPYGWSCATEAPFECSSGVAPADTELQDLTGPEQIAVCNWAKDVIHHAIGDRLPCGNGRELLPEDVPCESDPAAILGFVHDAFAGCKATMAEFELCVAQVVANPCNSYFNENTVANEYCLGICQYVPYMDPCTSDEECTTGACCYDQVTGERACRSFPCEVGDTGDPCVVDGNCGPGGRCEGGYCIVPGSERAVGDYCLADTWCASGHCISSACALLAEGAACASGAECDTGLCCPTEQGDTRCFDGDTCLALIGDPCSFSGDCASDECSLNSYLCTKSSCTSSAQCGFNSAGIQNFCVGTNPPFCARSCESVSCGANADCELWSEHMVCN